MWTSALMTAAFFALVTGDCHRHEDNYYADLGCKPAMVGDDGCPRSYDCSMIDKRDKTKCYYKGQGYEMGHELQDVAICVPSCRCENMYPGSNIGVFRCMRSECREHIFYDYQPGCYYLHEPGKCCTTGRVCSNSTSDQTTEQNAVSTVCRYKSQEYKLGAKFEPDEDPCLTCTCKAGFTGSLVEPYCTKTDCNLELHYSHKIAQGCIPEFYGEKSCCPLGWRCPDKSDFVIPAPVTRGSRNMDPDLRCQFGDVVMKIGDKLSPSKVNSPDTECTCRVPPHPVCIQKEHAPVRFSY